LGGLIPLAALVSRAFCRRDRSVAAAVQAICMSFGNIAILAVGIIVISGISITALVVRDATDLKTGSYAALLALKLVLFGLMLIVAGVNRFRLVPRLADPDHGSAAGRLWWSLLAEAILGSAVLVIAGALGITSPGADE
jgi:putative copper resistance protein D